jgi:serine O-acetyltransferase
MFKRIKSHLDNIKEKDPAAKGYLEVLFLYPSVHAVAAYKVSHFLFVHKRYFLARMISQNARFFTGIEIHPGATIGRNLFIDHGMGVVIGETAEIGNNVTLYQGVTLGGTGKDHGKRHPTIEDDVTIGSGAKILGPIRIAQGTKIGANSVVLSDTSTNSTAVGIPARMINRSLVQVVKLGAEHGHKDIYNNMVI